MIDNISRKIECQGHMFTVKTVINRLSRELPAVQRLPGFLSAEFLAETSRKRTIYYISEGQNWTIDLEGQYVDSSCKQRGLSIERTTNARFLSHGIIHFGSLWTFYEKFRQVNPQKNAVVVTLFHGDFNLDGTFDRALHYFLEKHPQLAKVVVSNSLMRDRLLGWGVPESKIALVPIGVDLNLFKRVAPIEKTRLRKKWSVPAGAICIGSFQKDGSGWGEGMQPKWIKGPDVFIEVCRQLAASYPLFCLLSGPSRGYVKTGLSNAGIPFKHVYLDEYAEVAELYQSLDLCIVTSREEGGPKSIMESMGTGVPVVTTRVGMAVDLVQDGINGFMTDVDNISALVQKSKQLIEDPALCEKLARAGAETVKPYDWTQIPELYVKLYKGLGA